MHCSTGEGEKQSAKFGEEEFKVFAGLLALLLCLLAGCAKESGRQITSLEQLNHPGCKIGVSSEAAEALVEHGYLTIEGLGNASSEDLAAIAELTDDDRAGIAQAVAAKKAAAPADAPATEAEANGEQA